MPSPFPGMDPQIEFLHKWADFHTDFLVGCREQLNRRLPTNYLATLGERILLVDENEEGEKIAGRVILPDVAVTQETQSAARSTGMEGRSAVLEPTTLPQAEWIEPPTQAYVQITYVPEERVVTDIELLSPSNKRAGSEDRLAYLAKRKHVLRHRIGLVELDLLIGGERLQMLAPLPKGDYYAFVTRSPTWRHCDVYAWQVRDPLPAIPVPLRPQDREVELDLGAAFAQTYERGWYERLLKYDRLPMFLSEQDRIWAEALLQAHAR
jgi:hypothetical protein